MAKKSVVNRNQKRIETVARFKERRQALKDIIDSNASLEEKFEARLKIQKLPRNSSPHRVRNRCQFTGRGRGVFRKYMISRIAFREMAHKGLIPGVTKGSW